MKHHFFTNANSEPCGFYCFRIFCIYDSHTVHKSHRGRHCDEGHHSRVAVAQFGHGTREKGLVAIIGMVRASESQNFYPNPSIE